MFQPLYAAGRATPADLETTWTLDHVLDELEAMSVDAENRRLSYEHAEKRAKQKR